MMGANYINFKATELVGSIRGTLTLEERNNGLVIEGQLSGIPVGKHGIHVHEYGSTGNECLDAGGHCTSVNITTLFPGRREIAATWNYYFIL